jgi:hypothetical protein
MDDHLARTGGVYVNDNEVDVFSPEVTVVEGTSVA